MAKAKFATGSNMPGYMPDSEPHHATWSDCKRCLVSDLEWHLETFSEDLDAEDQESMAETIRRAKSLKRGHEFGETVANRHYWLSRV